MATTRLSASPRPSAPGCGARPASDDGRDGVLAEPGGNPGRTRAVGAAAVRLLTWCTWAVAVLPRTGRPLGFSHDGRNAGVFSLMARGIDQLGWAGSRWGSELAHGLGSYAHHPPLLVWLVSLSERVGGTHPFWTRLPTVVASAIAIVLLQRICRRLTDDPLAAAVGCCVAVTAPMFLLYGWMLDTPMLALPAALVLADRWLALEDGEPVRPATWAVGAFVAGIAGWLGMAWAGVLGLSAVWRGGRPGDGAHGRRANRAPEGLRRESRVAGSWVLVGTAASFVMTIAWVAASRPGLTELFAQAALRSGDDGGGVGVLEALHAQVRYVADVWFPVPFVMAVVCLRAGRPGGRAGRVVLLLAGTTGLYALVFWNAATNHAYWLLWLVAPLAAVVATGLTRWSERRPPTVSTPALVAVAVVAAVSGPLWPGSSRHQLEDGVADGRLVARSALAPSQDRVLAAGVGDPVSWMSYATGVHVESLEWSGLAETAASHPGWHVVVPRELMDAACRSGRAPTAGPVDAGSSLVVVRATDAVRWLRPQGAASGTGSRPGSSSCR